MKTVTMTLLIFNFQTYSYSQPNYSKTICQRASFTLLVNSCKPLMVQGRVLDMLAEDENNLPLEECLYTFLTMSDILNTNDNLYSWGTKANKCKC